MECSSCRHCGRGSCRPQARGLPGLVPDFHVFITAPQRRMDQREDRALRLATFKTNGRVSYGAVTGSGIVDLGRKLAKYPTLLDVFRANAVAEARAAAGGP